MLEKVKQFLTSRKFLYLAIGLFLVQAVYFAVNMDYGIPSDEVYHFSYIKVYAARPLTAGPIIRHQTDHFDLGDIQQIPTYLFHYSLSFVQRITAALTTSEHTQVVVLRLINIIFGLLSMLVLARLLQRLGLKQLAINLVMIWMAISGMWVWVFAGINYDSLSMLLFFCMLDQLLRLVQKPALRPLLWSMVAALALLLTKATYQPIVLISFVLTLVWMIKRAGWQATYRSLWQSWQHDWQQPFRRAGVICLLLLTLLGIGLVTERYGQNYLRYGKATPICDQVHTVAECQQNGIYLRNTGQKQEFETFKKGGGKLYFTPWGFTGHWLATMYERTYYFWGHKALYASHVAWRLAAFTCVSCLLLVGAAIQQKFRWTVAQLWITILALAYVAMVFLYNLSVYLDEGYPFAFQGRYLLPALPFVYMIIVLCGLYLSVKLRGHWRQLLLGWVTLLIVANVVMQAPILLYLRRSQSLRWTPAEASQLQ